MTDPDCYWVEPGVLLAGEYPGAWDDDTAPAKLRRLLEAGVRTFVDLTQPGELEPYETILAEEAQRIGTSVQYHRRPVPDLDVPSVPDMCQTLAVVSAAIFQGAAVYVHCRGGIGRTGTLVGCWLVEQGLSGDEALDAIEERRKGSRTRDVPSPETDAQRTFVRRWAGGL